MNQSIQFSQTVDDSNKSLQKAIKVFAQTNNLINYQDVARYFQILVDETIKCIWSFHHSTILFEMNQVKLALEGSSINSSTAIGYIVEEFIIRQLPNFFKKEKISTNNSAYDFKYDDDGLLDLVVNLKAEKKGSNNKGICAGNILKAFYTANNKPKLYLIAKSKYEIDEGNSLLNIIGNNSIFLESFIMGNVNADKRNWSADFNPLSGRLQTPAEGISKNLSYKDIPEAKLILDFIQKLEDNF
ncbi:MAG: hypothetical protein MUE85_07555 [Microscillaceae bacterium]|jgi:hypothetical protein|nr:hypothetical protein [Microscillaceae bacterium]